MSGLIDPIHFEDLALRDPKEVCERTGCRYDDQNQCYLLAVWDMEYELFPHEQEVSFIDST